MSFLGLMLQAQPEAWGQSWEVFKGVLLTLGTSAALWSARTLFLQRDDTRDLKREVAEILPTVDRISKRLDLIEERNRREDWLDEQGMLGLGVENNRRQVNRRHRDGEQLP